MSESKEASEQIVESSTQEQSNSEPVVASPESSDSSSKRKYERAFLLDLQNQEHCTIKPDDYDSWPEEIQVDKATSAPSTPMGRGGLKKTNSGRGNRRDDRSKVSWGDSRGGRRGGRFGDREREKEVAPGPDPNLPALKTTDNRYIRQGHLAQGEEKVVRTVKSILNKLTLERFETLTAQLLSAELNLTSSPILLREVIRLLFEKAISEPAFGGMYARLCQILTNNLPPFNNEEDNKNYHFKRVLLNTCQAEFEKNDTPSAPRPTPQPAETSENPEDGETAAPVNDEAQDAESKARRRALGTIQFIGELYKQKMVPVQIARFCLVKLMGNVEEPNDEDIEILCKLWTTVGKSIDIANNEQSQEFIRGQFAKFEMLSENKKLSSRIRFMVRDLIELQQNRWVPRRAQETAKKIEDVHREAREQEEQMARIRAELDRQESQRRERQSGLAASNKKPTGKPNKKPDSRSPRAQPVLEDEWTTISNKKTPQSKGKSRGDSWGRGRGGSSPRSGRGGASQNKNVPQAKGRSGPENKKYNPKEPESVGNFKRGNTFAGLDEVEEPEEDTDVEEEEVKKVDDEEPAVIEIREPLSEDAFKKGAQSLLGEFFIAQDFSEACLRLKELNTPTAHRLFVKEGVVMAVDKKEKDCDLLRQLFLETNAQDLVTAEHFKDGFEYVFELLDDLEVDAPRTLEYCGLILGGLVAEDILPISLVTGPATDSLKDTGKAAKLVAFLLASVRSLKGEELARQLYADVDFVPLMRPNQRNADAVRTFLQDRGLEFLL
eukprot:TRINITY_DN27_c0_g1_i1.p1 TRINITY_DN27_c0_g1~~TRINITY_DN27_c0_g1_i1.p1  ORF type:complete len:778 (-),score=307.35 TRINITY_DN27_c0_g1_i1:308-2641(-)